ncbi:MAG TPA: hypothetical protein VF095_11530 [Bacillota bacterium]
MLNNETLFSFILASVLLFGCTTNSQVVPNDHGNDTQFTTISTNQATDQKISNQAKEKLSADENIIHVKAANSKKHLALAFEVPHLKRFQLQKIKKQVKDDLKREFPKMKVEVSTDQKIILELERLEEQLQTDSLSEKKLNKEMKRIIGLMKEQT